MKRILRIIQSHFYLNASGASLLVPIFTIILVLWTVIQCLTFSYIVSAYENEHKALDFSFLFPQMFNFINITSILISNSLIAPYINNKKKKSNYPLFLSQLPVYNKDLYTARFLMLQLEAAPLLFCILYFIGLNISVGSSDYLSSFSGFFTAIYCLCLIVLSTAIGFTVTQSKKYNLYIYCAMFFSIIPIVLMSILIIIISFVEPLSILNNSNLYNSLEQRFKACSFIGGVGGIVVILISTAISYLLSCKLPLKLLKNEG